MGKKIVEYDNRITIRLDKETRRKLQVYCEENGYKVSTLVRYLVAEYLTEPHSPR